MLVRDVVGKRHAANSQFVTGLWLYLAIIGGDRLSSRGSCNFSARTPLDLLMPLGDGEIITMAAYAA